MLVPAIAVGAIIASSAAMLRAVELARRFAPLPRPVVLVGQTGVGKGLLARFIHVQSGRVGNLVAVAGGDLSESLLHDQLAGHEAGAFTGAHHRVRGAFERAQLGTLFLDELPLWSRAAQSAVLRAVDERVITRLGAERELSLDCRVVVASNRSLGELVDDGLLLADLRWRIGEFVIEVPPLAGRAADIAALAYHFLDRSREEFGAPGPIFFAPEALDRLLTFGWPGNARQLRGVVEWSWTHAGLQSNERIELQHLPAYVSLDRGPRIALGSAERRSLTAWAYERTGRSRRRAARR